MKGKRNNRIWTNKMEEFFLIHRFLCSILDLTNTGVHLVVAKISSSISFCAELLGILKAFQVFCREYETGIGHNFLLYYKKIAKIESVAAYLFTSFPETVRLMEHMCRKSITACSMFLLILICMMLLAVRIL